MTTLKLIGSKLTKINVERNPDFKGNLEIKTNIKINSIEKISEKKDTLKVAYNFEVNYNELGKVLIEGDLFILGDSKTIKNILKTQKEKIYDSPEQVAISNIIIQKASLKAFELEEELGLPIHIKLPVLSIKKDN
ncbi:MAG: hypothetical protein KJ592_03570 [Nanoarchaeota archaeon]|nr:hypothetical protein [Nanoarchaeota archaeon]